MKPMRIAVVMCLALSLVTGAASARGRGEPKHDNHPDAAQTRPPATADSLARVKAAHTMHVQTLLQQAAQLPAAAETAARMRRARVESDRGLSDAGPPAADPSTGNTDTSSQAQQRADLVVPGPVTGAVARICGADVTVCGVWWSTALGDHAAYQSCMLHMTAASGDLEFGTTPDEYCSSLYSGDCDAATPQSNLGELCSLVPGTAAQWDSKYVYFNLTTAGDCAYYKAVSIAEKNVTGLKFTQPVPEPAPEANAGGAQGIHFHICTGRLYLKSAP